MSWAESMVAADEVIKEVRKGFMNPRAASSLSIAYDRTNMIATLSIGDSTPVYIDTYADETTETSDRAAISTTVKFEIWRRENADILSYGEGEKIATINKSDTVTTYTDNLLAIATDQIFTYAVFSVSDKGNVNKIDFIKKDLNVRVTIFEVYGFKQDFSDTDPSTTISYPSELVDPDDEYIMYQFINAEYTPMSNNKNNLNHYTDIGSFSSFLFDFLKNKPYMVKSPTGRADYMLSTTDYSKKSDNTTPSDFANASTYAGGPFAWINKVYSKEIYDTTNNCRYVMYSDNADTKEYGFAATGFINPSNQELEGVWIPMGYTDTNGKLCGGVTGVVSQDTATQKTTIEKLNSTRAKFFGGPILNILRDMLYMLFKSTDIQATAGYGRCNGYGYQVTGPDGWRWNSNAYAIPNGNLKNGSTFTVSGTSGETMYDESGSGFMGSANEGTKAYPAKYFHSQVLGSYNTFIRDPYTLAVNGKIKVSPNYSYDITGDSYVDTGITYDANKSGYPVKLVHTEAGSIPDLSDTSGSTSTGLCDYSDVSVSGVRVARRLGGAGYDLNDGPAYIDLGYGASYSSKTFGVATLLLPDPGYSPE